MDRESDMGPKNKVSLLLFLATLLWILQMTLSVTIMSTTPGVFLFEVAIKVFGILTVMFAYWITLECSEGNQVRFNQLAFFFLAMLFAGDYGLPTDFFLDLFHPRGVKSEQDNRSSLASHQTLSHNVVSQTGMYILFLLIIMVECSRTLPDIDGEAEQERDEEHYRPGFFKQVQRLYHNYGHTVIDYHVLQLFFLWIWPPLLALTILYYTHKLEIYIITTSFYTLILIMMIFIRYMQHRRGNWSDFYNKYHPGTASRRSLITLGLYSKVAVYGLTSLFVFTICNEIEVTNHSNLLIVGIPTLSLLPMTLLLHFSNWP